MNKQELITISETLKTFDEEFRSAELGNHEELLKDFIRQSITSILSTIPTEEKEENEDIKHPPIEYYQGYNSAMKEVRSRINQVLK